MADLSDRTLTLQAGLALLVPASLGLLATGGPTILCPFPTFTILPAFLFSAAFPLAIIVPPLFFFAWNPALFRGESKTPRRTYALFGALIALSVAYFVASWGYGLKYQGKNYTMEIAAANVVWILVLSVLFILSRKRSSSFRFNLLLHWFLFAWLAWYAFPYLGELP